MQRFRTVREGAGLSYCVDGQEEGPWVLLHHALTSSSRSFVENGVVGALIEAGFRCLVPDALGHGESDLVPQSERHGVEARAKDVLAIMDHAGAERVAFAGYSMGAWVGTGLMKMAPKRFSGCSLGGWDPLNGARYFTTLTAPSERRSEFLKIIRVLTDKLDAAPSREQLKGYVGTYERLFADLPPVECLAGRNVAFAVGGRDPYEPFCRKAADLTGASLDLLPGDHVSAFWTRQYREHIVSWAERLGGGCQRSLA